MINNSIYCIVQDPFAVLLFPFLYPDFLKYLALSTQFTFLFFAAIWDSIYLYLDYKKKATIFA